MKERLVLGTVQFGLDYGINNHSGKVTSTEVNEILEICQAQGINILDTAHAYGCSEEVLGENGVDNFKMISKLPPGCKAIEVRPIFEESLIRLKIKKLYAYMLHNFSIYKNDPSVWQELMDLKKEGKIEKIGVSLYGPEELQKLFDDGIELDIVQIPYNIFDRRFKNYLPVLKEKGIEIHIRSSFLQGLFFKPLSDLPAHFEKVRYKLGFLEKFKNQNQIGVVELCLGFVLSNPNIDKVVIGVDSSKQLLSNISAVTNIASNIDWSQLAEMEENDMNIIHPSLWKI